MAAKKQKATSDKAGKADPKPDLAEVRAQIDGIDRRIQELIAERANWAHQVGKAKGKLAAAVDYYRPEREAQVLRRVVDRNDGPLSDEVLVLHSGKRIAEGKPEAVQNDPTVIRVYLGGELDNVAPSQKSAVWLRHA